MEIVEIKPNVFACLTANETANAGFVLTERGAIVIDTLDKPARGREMAAAIQARTDKPVALVINTHHHYEHVFGNQAFDAPVIGHCALSEQLAQAAARNLMPFAIAARVSQHPEDHWMADELELVYPSIIFDNHLILDMPPLRLVVQHLGGHSPDACIVDLPEEGVLFASDLIFEGRVPFLRQANIKDTLLALHKIEKLGDRIVVPGHGALCDMAYVRRLRDYVESLQGKVKELIDAGWDKGDALDSDQLPGWWTEDRPELTRANAARVYDELSGGPGLP